MTKETSNEITPEIWILDTPIYLLFLKPSWLQDFRKNKKKKSIREPLKQVVPVIMYMIFHLNVYAFSFSRPPSSSIASSLNLSHKG